MKSILDDVRAFHVACAVPVLDKPELPSPERMHLRLALISEEYKEFCDALAGRDIVGIADALGDMVYVIAGTALEFGIPLDRVWAEIQRSNMAKVDPATGAVRRRADGKILKPEGWSPPDIAGALGAV